LKEKSKNQKNEIIRDLKYILNVSHKGRLWWKKPIYKTFISDIITLNDKVKPTIIERLYKGDDKYKNDLLIYVDDKLEDLNIFSKSIIPDNYIMSVNSQWSDKELDMAIDNFVNNVIRYKS
jgi:hypothetical protein